MKFYPTIPRVDADSCGHGVAAAANLEFLIAPAPLEWSLCCLWFVAQWGSGLRNCSVMLMMLIITQCTTEISESSQNSKVG